MIECSLGFCRNLKGIYSLFIDVWWLQPDFWIDSNFSDDISPAQKCILTQK